jgi:hypothetical protein
MTDLGQANYTVWLNSTTGKRLDVLDGFTKLQVVTSEGDVGQWSYTLPLAAVDQTLIRKDAMTEIWRTAPGQPPALQMVGFLRRPRYFWDGKTIMVTLGGPDVNYILTSRMVTAGSQESAARKTSTAADDVMKDIVRRSMGSLATDATRDLSALNFTVEADAGAGPLISRSYPRRVVLDVLREIADAARAAGTRVLFGVTPTPLGDRIGLEFRTWITRRGANRTAGQPNQAVFGLEWGNLEAPDLIEDYTDEITRIYAGGEATGADREIVQREDAARTAESPWSLREGFLNASAQTTTAELNAAGDAALEALRPRVMFSGELKHAPQTRYGVDWNFGDSVTATFGGRDFNGVVDKVRLTRDRAETIEASLDVETTREAIVYITWSAAADDNLATEDGDLLIA